MLMTCIWLGMVAVAVLWGAAAGTLSAVSAAVTAGAGDAVTLCIGLAGALLLWSALMELMRQSGLLAVSVVGPCSARCDALSTVCFALGAEAGCELIDRLDGYEAVFIRSDGTQVKSAGFAAMEVK